MSGIEELVIAAGELAAAVELVKDGTEAAISAVQSAYEGVVSLFSPLFPIKTFGSYKDPVVATSYWMSCYMSPITVSTAINKILTCDPTDRAYRTIIYHELDHLTNNSVWIYSFRFPEKITLIPMMDKTYRSHVTSLYSQLSAIAMYSKMSIPPPVPYENAIKSFGESLDAIAKGVATGLGFMNRNAIEMLPGMIWNPK